MASDKIDMSLEDIIKSSRKSGKGGASGRGQGHGVGARGGAGGRGGGRGRVGAGGWGGSGGAGNRGDAGGKGGAGGRVGGRRLGGVRKGHSGGLSRKIDGPRRGAPSGGVGLQQVRRPTPYVRPVQVPDIWEHDLYEGDRRTRGLTAQGAPAPKGNLRPAGGKVTGTLLIANLDFGVSDIDITDLFKEFGVLKKASIHYDK